MCRACIGDLFGIERFFSAEPSRGRFIATSAAAAGLAAIVARPSFAGTAAEAPQPSIFYGGTIVTMDDAYPSAGAVAIANGKILAVGETSEVMRAAGRSAQRVNLDGRTLMPGLIDPHQHPLPGGIMLTQMIDVGSDTYKSKADVLAALKAKAAQAPSGQWIYADLYDNLLQGGDLSIEELDGVSAVHPIFVYYVSMHTATGNSLAFKLAGVTSATGELPGGGHFGKNSSGDLNGMIFEPPALQKFLIGMPKLSLELVGAATRKFLYQSAKLGITMVHEAGAYAPTPSALEGYKAVMASSPVRYSVSPAVEFLDAAIEFVKPYGVPGAKALEIPGTLLSFYAVKIVSDGSPQQQTAFQLQPYLNSTNIGLPNYTVDQLNALVLKVKQAGWPVSVHCNGDASLQRALDAIEAAYGPTPSPTGVNRIEHCTLANPDQIARMKAMGVQPSHLMNNLYYYGAAYRDQIFGPDRANRFNPAGSYLAAGIPFSIHSDSPCSPVAPLREIGTAVTRICSIDGSVVGENERVPIEAALRGMTIVAAMQCGMGDKTGSLSPGKYADLAILESNPITTDPTKLGDIAISETWVGGSKIVVPS